MSRRGGKRSGPPRRYSLQARAHNLAPCCCIRPFNRKLYEELTPSLHSIPATRRAVNSAQQNTSCPCTIEIMNQAMGENPRRAMHQARTSCVPRLPSRGIGRANPDSQRRLCEMLG